MYSSLIVVVLFAIIPNLLCVYIFPEKGSPFSKNVVSRKYLVSYSVLIGQITATYYILYLLPSGLELSGFSPILEFLSESVIGRGIFSIPVFLLGMIGFFGLGVIYLGGLILPFTPYLFYQIIIKKRFVENETMMSLESLYTTMWQRIIFLGVLLLSATYEEVIYRGYLVMYFGQISGHIIPMVIISSILFSLAHGWHGVKRLIYYTGFGVYSSIIGLYTSNILILIGMHTTINGLPILQSWFYSWLKSTRPEQRSMAFDNEELNESGT